MNALAQLPSLSALADEYTEKHKALPQHLAEFEQAGVKLKSAASLAGEVGQESIDIGRVALRTLETNLLRSAWIRVWKGLDLPTIASAKDKKLWEQALSSPAPFTLDNLRATFSPYLANPRQTILRGMAEVFADLDPSYKSHEKVKVGVKGLPKRVILNGIGSIFGHGMDKARDIINALAAYQGKPLATYAEITALERDGDALRVSREVPCPFQSRYEREADPKTIQTVGRGIWLKRFKNGNGHLFFGPDALRDINLALAEFYGDVLADCPNADEARPSKRQSTEVSKDLQFYPTPQAVIDRVLSDIDLRGKRILEPSCGDGRIMDAMRKAGATACGVEIDRTRANICKDKGFGVIVGNFLEVIPNADLMFDAVIMNPPFYGRHYAKHVRHALKFIKPNGTLIAILPATARYDHGELDALRPYWRDLPIGAFSESGTNICTTVATIRKSA